MSISAEVARASVFQDKCTDQEPIRLFYGEDDLKKDFNVPCGNRVFDTCDNHYNRHSIQSIQPDEKASLD